MTKLKITSKKQAFEHCQKEPNVWFYAEKYCSGKYKGTAKDYFGKEVDQLDDKIAAVYTENRYDTHGKYVQLMCLVRSK